MRDLQHTAIVKVKNGDAVQGRQVNTHRQRPSRAKETTDTARGRHSGSPVSQATVARQRRTLTGLPLRSSQNLESLSDERQGLKHL